VIILVTGDRNWADKERIYWTLSQIDSEETFVPFLIHGNANGADKMAADCAYDLGWRCKSVPAQWEKYGRAAGPIRNQQMLDMNPDLVIAFHEDLENSKGTKDMVNRAKKKGVKVIHIGSKK